MRNQVNRKRAAQRRILVVDDEPSIRRILSLILQRDGHVVTEACSGVEALGLFEPGKFDLIFTDHFMPAMKGDELAAALKKRAPQQMIVMLTASLERFRSSGGAKPEVDYLMGKPFEIETLREAVASCASRQKLRGKRVTTIKRRGPAAR